MAEEGFPSSMLQLQPDTTVLRGQGGEEIWFEAEKVVKHFGRSEYRQYQKETIEEISSAYSSGYRYVVLDAPTGSGKSEIAACFARASNDSHILTIQKLLQEQYQVSMPDFAIMKGRNSYDCLRSVSGATCAEGACRMKKQNSCEGCLYKSAKLQAMDAAVTVHNFDSFYYQNAFGHGFGKRNLLVIDECQNISEKFSGFLSFTINSRGGIEVPEADSISEYTAFIKSAYDDYMQELEGLDLQYNLNVLSRESLFRMQELSAITHRMLRYMREQERSVPSEYVFDYTTQGRYAPSVTFRPVSAGEYASKWLFGYGERILMMSATILDKNMFCRESGLDADEVYYISVPCTFPPENRPIMKKYAGKMGYKDIDSTLPKIVDYINEIVGNYPDRKGIVQTHSEKIANYLKTHLTDPRFTYNKDFESPQRMLEVHAEKLGSIIIASGLREGLDLRGDMSKVQIFCKVPYPSLGDKVVVRKMELDPEWYGWITTVMFVQSLGRSVRSSKEKAVTYILDSGFSWYYKQYKQFIPEYIREAICW